MSGRQLTLLSLLVISGIVVVGQLYGAIPLTGGIAAEHVARRGVGEFGLRIWICAGVSVIWLGNGSHRVPQDGRFWPFSIGDCDDSGCGGTHLRDASFGPVRSRRLRLKLRSGGSGACGGGFPPT